MRHASTSRHTEHAATQESKSKSEERKNTTNEAAASYHIERSPDGVGPTLRKSGDERFRSNESSDERDKSMNLG